MDTLKTFVFWIYVLPVALAVITYGCRDLRTNVSAISIRDVGECPPISSGYNEYRSRVQIVQKNDLAGVAVQVCLIEITRLIQRCGMFSHISAVNNGLHTYVKPIGAEECRNLHRFRSYQGAAYLVENIRPNTTTTASLTLAGEIDSEGKCHGTSYTENGITWSDVVVSATVKIHIKDYIASASLDSNEIHLMGGVTSEYTAGYCMDMELGETIWERGTNEQCSKNTYTVIYEGFASFITVNKTDILTESRYIVVEEGDRVFALTLVAKSYVCFQEAWITEHPRLVIVEEKVYGFKFEKKNLYSRNADLVTYMNTKFMYVELSFRRAIRNVHIDMIHRRCTAHRETLRNRLLLAPLAANSVSILMKNQPGYFGRVLGEVIYIMQCTPKIANVRRTENCYNELPVTVNNESLFMAPITHILQTHGEQVECSHVTPPLYYIGNQWIGFSPLPQVQVHPDVLEVQETPKIDFKPLQNLGIGGIYTYQEIRDAQRNLIFGAERKTVSNILTRKISGLNTDVQGYSTLKLFDEREMQTLVTKTIHHIWGWFTDLGLVTSGLIGFYVIFRIIKYIIGTILNGITLYRTTGPSLTMLACVWNTLTMWMINRAHWAKTTTTTITEEMPNQEDNVDPRDNEDTTVKESTPYHRVIVQLNECDN